VLLAGLLALVLLLPGTYLSPQTPAAAQDLWSGLLTGIEVMIGESVAASVRQEYGQPVKLPPARQRWVDSIFADIAGQASRTEINYTLEILDTRVVNAFAAPGGYIFLTTGLLSHIGEDAHALANVLGHEVAHVELKHGMNTLVRQLGMGFFIRLLLGDQSDRTWRTVVGVATELVRLGWSREQEYEADDLGQHLAAAAGYDPWGMVRFFEALRRLEGQEVPCLEFLRTHPLTSERMERARVRAQALEPEGAPASR